MSIFHTDFILKSLILYDVRTVNVYVFPCILTDNSSACPEKNHRTADSDNEEFCDSMEHLAMEEAGGLGSVVRT